MLHQLFHPPEEAGLMSSYPALLLWMFMARAIRITIIGRIALPLPSK